MKKADAGEHPEVFARVGLLGNEPPGPAGVPFIQSSDHPPPLSTERRREGYKAFLYPYNIQRVVGKQVHS
jgi:hypothetical protein